MSPDLAIIVQQNLHLEGKPFRLTGRRYLRAVYNSPKRKIILKTARQVEKSTTIAAMEAVFLADGGYRTGLYVAPRPNHVKLFSTNRFRPMIVQSPRLRPLLTRKGTYDALMDKHLANGSWARFRVAYLTADQARGITSDFLALDEMQGLMYDHIPIIEQTQSHRPEGRRIYAGTPLTYSNPMEKWWERSTQKEWITRCDSGHVQETALTMENIGPRGPICAKAGCDSPVDPSRGRWRARFKDAEYDGYHLNQLMVPWYQVTTPEGEPAWNEILQNREHYPEYEFRNEVLGESFQSGEALLSPEDIYACCKDYRFTHRRATMLQGDTPVFMGLDWGGDGLSRTAIAIGAYFDGRFHLLDGYLLEGGGRNEDQDLEIAAKVALEWKVSWIAADSGFDAHKNRVLKRRVGPRRLYEFTFSGTAGADLTYHAVTRKYTANRLSCLRETWSGIKNKWIAFPRRPDMEGFVPDLTSLYQEERGSSRHVRWDHKAGERDDFYFALTLAYVSCLLHQKKIPNVLRAV